MVNAGALLGPPLPLMKFKLLGASTGLRRAREAAPGGDGAAAFLLPSLPALLSRPGALFLPALAFTEERRCRSPKVGWLLRRRDLAPHPFGFISVISPCRLLFSPQQQAVRRARLSPGR